MALSNKTTPTTIIVSGDYLNIQAKVTTDSAAPGKGVKITAASKFPEAASSVPSIAVISAAADKLLGILDVNEQTGGDISATYSQNEIGTIIVPFPGFRFWGKKDTGAISALASCDVDDSGDFATSNTGIFICEYAAASADSHVLLRYLPSRT